MSNTNSFFKRILAILLSIVFAISSFAVTGFSAVTALADDGEYFIMAYFTGNGDAEASTKENQAIRFAVSSDGENFSALNNNDPIIKQVGGTRNVRDPYIFKGQDDYYYLIGTDLDVTDTGFWGNQPQMVIWRSADLITWDHESYINAAQICGLRDDQVQRTWAPQVIWDTETNKYMVYFAFAADGYATTRMHYMLTDDLLDQSHYSVPAVLYDPGFDDIDSDITYQDGVFYMFYKDETPGRSTICLATATSATGPYDYVGQLEQKSETGALEGCEVYTVGSNYYLMADRFGDNGNFAIYNLGSDLSKIKADGSGIISVSDSDPVSTVNGTTGFNNLTVRHGSVMHISKAQYEALINTYGASTSDDVTLCFDKDYSKENAWGYDTYKDASGHPFDIMTNTGKYSYVFPRSRFLSLNGGNIFINDSAVKDMFKSGSSWTASFNASVVEKRGAPLFALTSGASPSGSIDWVRFLDNGDFYVYYSGEYHKVGSTDITTTTDYDFDITYNGSYITLYKDGAKAFTSNVGALGYDRNASTSYVAFGWTDTIGTNGIHGSYTNVRFRSRAISAGEVAIEYTDNMIYQYNEGTHEAIDGRANVTYNSPQTTATYVGEKGGSFAIAGWVNIGAYKHDDSVLFEFGDGGTSGGKTYLALLEDGRIRWCWNDGSTSHYLDADDVYNFSENTYYYVQINIVPEGNNYNFQAFLNGESVKDITSGYNSMTTYDYGPINFLGKNQSLRFGQGNAHWTTAGYNIIDDIRVYNRAVDAAANYEKILVDDAAADARTYVRENLEDYDVTATANKASRKAYFMSSEQEAVGGYSNVVACSTGVSYNYVWDDSSKKNNVHYSLWYPSDIVLMYDGVNTPALPVQMELHNYNSSGNASNLNTVYCYNGSNNGVENTTWKFAHYWTGYGDNYEVWTGTAKTYNHSKEYPKKGDGLSEVEADGNDHIGYYPGSDYDYVFNMPNADGRFFWNKINFVGTPNTTNYIETYTSIPVQAYQGGYQTLREVTHNMYVVNYQPIYNMLKASGATAVPNAGGLGLKAVYQNLIKDNENNWTTDSLNQFYVAAYKVLKANPMEYSEATYQADFSGTASKAAANIKSAVSEFNKINLKSRASFGDLESAVADAQEILDNSADNYTAASIAALEAAVDGVTFLDYTAEERANMAADIYQDDIDEETTAVSTAYAALIGKIAVTYDRYGESNIVVKFEPGTSAADVEAAAPALPENNFADGKHYTYSWDKDFAAVTEAVTYTQERSEVPHNYTYTHIDSSDPSQHTASCSVNGQSHSETVNCSFTGVHTNADGNTNGYTTYTCDDCGYQYVEYDAQDFTAYTTAYADYEATIGAADYEAHYTAASRTAYEGAVAAAAISTSDETISAAAIANAAAAITAAKDELAVQYYTISFTHRGSTTSTSIQLPYGATAEDVAAQAPENTATDYNESRHYTYVWETFVAVTGNKNYIEDKISEPHSYTPVHTEADGALNGYTTYTCVCGHSYVTYDAQDWTAYDAAVAAYDEKAAEEDFETHYTSDSRTAFASAASSKLTKADTVSQDAIDTAAAALNGAVSGLVEIVPDNGYNLTLEDTVDVNFFIDTEFYDAEGGYIKYTFLANPNDKDATRTTYTVQDNSEELVVLPNGKRKLSIDVAPAQLAEKFSIDVYNAAGDKVTAEPIEASISDYCEAILASADYAEYHEVIQSLLDYGALADEYFGYAAISKDVTGEDYEVPHSENYKAAVDAESFKSKAKAKFTAGVDASGKAFTITGVTYIALVDPEFRFYISQENEVWAALTEVEVLEGEGLTAEMVRTDLGNCVRVTGLKSSDFGKTFKIRIGTAVLEYNGYAYLYTTLREQSQASDSLKDLAKGVYRYAAACDEYFNNKN